MWLLTKIIFPLLISFSDLQASLEDDNDCLKMFTCELAAMSDSEQLTMLERDILDAFPAQSESDLDLSKVTIEFDVAAAMGRKMGKKQCDIIYGRCPMQRQQISQLMNKVVEENPQIKNFIEENK